MIINHLLPSLKTNIAPENEYFVLNASFLLGAPAYFQGQTVSFRECKWDDPPSSQVVGVVLGEKT